MKMKKNRLILVFLLGFVSILPNNLFAQAVAGNVAVIMQSLPSNMQIDTTTVWEIHLHVNIPNSSIYIKPQNRNSPIARLIHFRDLGNNIPLVALESASSIQSGAMNIGFFRFDGTSPLVETQGVSYYLARVSFSSERLRVFFYDLLKESTPSEFR